MQRIHAAVTVERLISVDDLSAEFLVVNIRRDKELIILEGRVKLLREIAPFLRLFVIGDDMKLRCSVLC